MDRLKHALQDAREGTARTFRWMTGRLRSDEKSEPKTEEKTAEKPATTAFAAAPGAGDDTSWGDRVSEKLGRSQRTIGLAIGVALIVLIWLGWTAYVWAENGMTAGIGVLISWPAVFAILGLILSPFIGGAVAVRRHRAGQPILATAGGVAAPDAPAGDSDSKDEDKKGWEPKAASGDSGDVEQADDKPDESGDSDDAEGSGESDEESDDSEKSD